MGVARTASPETIRAAYIALMKMVHPDVAGPRGRQAEVRAKAINEAISTLRNPRKRAIYDAQLQSAEEARRMERAQQARRARSRPQAAPAGAARPAHPPRPPQSFYPLPVSPGRRARNLASTLLLLLLIGGSFGFALGGGLDQAPTGSWRIGPAPATAESDPLRRQPRILEVDVGDAVADANWIAAYGTGRDAVRYSRGCFAEVVEYPNFRLLDRCVAFDLAWRYRAAIDARSDPAAQSFFASDTVAKRHAAALARITDEPENIEARIAKLDSITVSEVADTMDVRPSKQR